VQKRKKLREVRGTEAPDICSLDIGRGRADGRHLKKRKGEERSTSIKNYQSSSAQRLLRQSVNKKKNQLTIGREKTEGKSKCRQIKLKKALTFAIPEEKSINK